MPTKTLPICFTAFLPSFGQSDFLIILFTLTISLEITCPTTLLSVVTFEIITCQFDLWVCNNKYYFFTYFFIVLLLLLSQHSGSACVQFFQFLFLFFPKNIPNSLPLCRSFFLLLLCIKFSTGSYLSMSNMIFYCLWTSAVPALKVICLFAASGCF